MRHKYIVISGGKFLTARGKLSPEYGDGATFVNKGAAIDAAAKLDGFEVWRHEDYAMGGKPVIVEHSAAYLAGRTHLG